MDWQPADFSLAFMGRTRTTTLIASLIRKVRGLNSIIGGGMIGQVYIESPLLTQQNQQELVRWARELQTMTIIKTQEMSV